MMSSKEYISKKVVISKIRQMQDDVMKQCKDAAFEYVILEGDEQVKDKAEVLHGHFMVLENVIEMIDKI